MKNKVIRQLNVLTSGQHDSDADASEWEILTEDIGRLMEDPESGPDEDDAQSDRLSGDERFNRSPTPYQECEQSIKYQDAST